MDKTLIIILTICIFLIIYNYALYPLSVIILSKIKSDKHTTYLNDRSEYAPSVSFIIAAYNEETVIDRKIKNTLSLDYPDDKIEIIVISDGSTDATPEIAKKYSGNGVLSLHEPARNGKTAALNRAVEHATGEILVFSDANNDYQHDAVDLLIRHFKDPEVGAVTGCKHIYENQDRQSSKGDGLYWKYESRIKQAESSLGSITAAEGEILAVRKSMYQPINPELINDDAAITFHIVKSNHRILYDIEAKAYEEASIDLVDDFHVKVRMAAGGYQTLMHEKSYLFPPRTWFSFSFLSHKLLRWITPHLLILILLLSMSLLDYNIIKVLLVIQFLFYGLAFLGWTRRHTPDLATILYVPTYFVSMNTAMFFGFIRYLTRTSSVNWRKAER